MYKNAIFAFQQMKELLKKVKTLEIKTRRMVEATFAGEYHSAFKGQGLEFDEVRLYQFGDDIRSIDWNVTAKTGEVYVKIFREEREQNLFVLFDISKSEDFGGDKGNKLMIGTEIAAILAFSAMKNNDKIGLVTFTERVETYYPPKKGRKHILGLIRSLLNEQAKNIGTDIKHAVDYVKKILKRRSILIVISDFLDEGYENALSQLSGKHEVILIRLFNPKEIFRQRAGIIPIVAAESGKLMWINSSSPGYRKQLEGNFKAIDEKLKTLAARHNMDYVSIDTDEDYFPVLEKFFHTRNARLRSRRG